jgi:hypothetical protein
MIAAIPRPGGHMIGIGILIAIVPSIVMAFGAIATTRWMLRSSMFHSEA